MPGVGIINLDSLKDLKVSFERFQIGSEEFINHANAAINELLRKIDSKKRSFNNAIIHSEELVREAEFDLRSSEAGGYYDEDDDWIEPDCSYEEYQLSEAKANLKENERKYSECVRILRPIYSALEIVKRDQSGFDKLLEEDGIIAIRALHALINGAEDYLNKKTYSDNPSISVNSDAKIQEEKQGVSISPTNRSPFVISNGVSFSSKSGAAFELKEKINRNLVQIHIFQDGKPITGGSLCCGNYRIEIFGKERKLKILDVIIPPAYREQGLGTKVIKIIEKAAVENSCTEIYGWDQAHDFYKKIGYDFRNGNEFFKEVDETLLQSLAKETFKDYSNKIVNGKWEITDIKLKHEIDSSLILAPDINDRFWTQHSPEGKEGYEKLIRDFETANGLIKSGTDADKLWKESHDLQNAYRIFINEPIRLLEKDGFYMIDENGRHRVAIAQELGVKIPAEVKQINKVEK